MSRLELPVRLLVLALLLPAGCSRFPGPAPSPSAPVDAAPLAVCEPVALPPDLPESEPQAPAELTITVAEHDAIVARLMDRIDKSTVQATECEKEASRLTAALNRAWTANDALSYSLDAMVAAREAESAGSADSEVIAKLDGIAATLEAMAEADASNVALALDRLDSIVDLIGEQPPPTPIDPDAAKWAELAGMVRDGTIPSTDKLVAFADSIGLSSAARITPIRGKVIEFTAENRSQWADWLVGAGPLPAIQVGPRHVVIVYETADSTAAFGRLRTGLRTGDVATYLLDHGHRLTMTDDDPGSSGIADKLRPEFASLTLPAILILDDSGAVIHKATLPDSATPDSVLAILKANGG